jgi:predicted lipoprotein with Yx(FWY)xxD motif
MRRVPLKTPEAGRRHGTVSRARTNAVALVLASCTAATIWSGPASASKGFSRAEVSAVSTSQYGSVLVAGSGRLRGFPLYMFSGDADGKFGCGTKPATGYDLGPDANMPLTCTGPESDLVDAVKSDDWPAFTSAGPPFAGAGINPRLLGTVERPGVGDQVTYAGHPLYLFDPVSKPFDPEGEGYIETVKPLAPWHGYWFLVSSETGNPAPGAATIERGTLPDGKKVLAVEVDENVSPIAATVYALSGTTTRAATCAGSCAVTWVPVLTASDPRLGPRVPRGAIGVLRRANGTEQVTYHGAPLYLYARERVFLTPLNVLKSSGTGGNGEGVKGPGGGTFRWIPLSR